MHTSATHASAVVSGEKLRACSERATSRGPERARRRGQRHAEEIADLGARDEDGDPVGETDDDRPRNVGHRGAHSGRAEDDEDAPRHHGAHEQAVDAVGRDDAGDDDDDEGARRTADLKPRSAKR
jgi:hypothetical protein